LIFFKAVRGNVDVLVAIDRSIPGIDTNLMPNRTAETVADRFFNEVICRQSTTFASPRLDNLFQFFSPFEQTECEKHLHHNTVSSTSQLDG
jgi:hypothetical protein